MRPCCLARLQYERDDALPTNVTFLFYELEQLSVVPKHYLDAQGRKRPGTPRQDISDATMCLRKLGLVPWWWLVDESREVATSRYAASVYDYVLDTVPRARIDAWDGEAAPKWLH